MKNLFFLLLLLASSVQAGVPYITTAMQNPFEFPYGAQMKHFQTFWPQQMDAGATVDVLNVTGAGVVREMQFVIALDDSDADDPSLDITKHLLMNIKVDGESTPSTRIPLCHLVCWLAPGNVVTNTYSTPWFNVMDMFVKDINFAAGFSVKYQIPFTNGIRIYLTDDGLEPNFSVHLSCDTFYQNSLPDCPNRSLRFFATNIVATNNGWNVGAGTIAISGVSVTGTGTGFSAGNVGKYLTDGLLGAWDAQIISVADSTHLTIAANDTNNVGAGHAYGIADGFPFFTRPTGKSGFVAAVYGGLSTRTNRTDYFEANTRFMVNQESAASLEWGATEDFFTGDFYFGNTPASQQGAFQHENGGVVASSVVGGGNLNPKALNLFSGYRLFRATPINYTNGIRGVNPINIFKTWQWMTNNWTTVYYEYR